MLALCDAFTINVLLGALTVIFGPGDTTEFITLENPSVVIAMVTFTADITVTFNTMLEDSASELFPNAIENNTSGLKRIKLLIMSLISIKRK